MTQIFKTITNTVKHWYLSMFVGILFIILGIYVFTVPLETYVTLSYIFSISFLVSGILDIYFSISNRNSLSGWGWQLALGIMTLFIGIYLLANPAISITTLPLYVGFVLMFHSIMGIGFAFDLKEIKSLKWGDLAILSILSLLVSFFLIAHPIFTGFSLVWLTAFSFIFFGISAIVLSFKIKKLKDIPSKIKSELRDKIDQLRKETEVELNK